MKKMPYHIIPVGTIVAPFKWVHGETFIFENRNTIKDWVVRDDELKEPHLNHNRTYWSVFLKEQVLDIVTSSSLHWSEKEMIDGFCVKKEYVREIK